MNNANSYYDKLSLLRKRFMLTFLVLLFSGTALMAQENITVTGIVTSKGENLPLPGVNVIQEGTSNGVVTDMEGRYSISVPEDAVLNFSYIGFESEIISVDGQANIDIVLAEDYASLDDVVVVGYGTQRRQDVTGSVASIDAEEVQKQSNNDVSRMLQGRTAGVTVTSNGEPGAGGNVRIRGVATFGDNQPLYIVDGVPVGTSIRDFNPNDIESIEVLKDASAGAIYGSRAANGVVIITTKSGKKNTPLQIKYSGYYGIDEVAQDIPVLGREDYQMISNEKRTNAGLPLIPGNDPSSDLFVDNIDTDWQEVGLQSGSRQNHNLNFSGGGDNITYNASLDYFNNEGVFVGKGPDYERYSGRINTTMEKGIFKISPSLYYTHSFENSLTFRDDVLTGGRPPLINDLVNAIPTLGIYDENNEGGYAGTSSEIHQEIILNVPGINSLFTNTVEVDRIFAIVNPELKLLDTDGHELTYKLNTSYDKTHVRSFSFVPEFEMGYFFGSGRSLLDDNSSIYTVALIENTLNYKKEFGKHGVDVLLGQTYQENSTVLRQAHSESLPKPYYPVLSNGSNQTVGGEEIYSSLASYFGRLNYNFDDRYLLTATVRRDGSSRFAPENRYGTFPSLALGWRLSNEDFFNVPEVDQLKFRASYGELGNQNIGDYLYQAVINRNIPYNFGGNRVLGGLQTSIIAEDIKWETTTSLNLGMDVSLFNNKIDLTLEYYDKETNDVLVGVPIPASTGSINTAPTINAGSLKNSGFDAQITYHYNNEEDFSFDISANASTIKNEVLALGGSDEPIAGVGSRTQVGGEVGEHFGFVYDGIFQSAEEVEGHAFQNAATSAGDVKFADINEDGVIDANDRTFLGSAIPSVTYGLNFTAQYKNFDLTMFASGAAGYYINSRLYRSLMLSTGFINAHEDILDRWTPQNTETNIPRVVANDPNNNARDSNRPGWLQKGDHLRINTLSLGYSLPQGLFEDALNSARIYATVQNLYTFQYYDGFNPDFNSGVFEPGFDNGTYPKPRTFMLGVDLSF
ncbi:SusC/RagA family TonB-linked outer membrane protein [Salegentibacter salinarum]|uniref:SusC/RagA family TonB-linked outer membrane protein n=1 Tax=Salegentibacter salinarum TaxID=447422 RepID=A0A2N0TY61_9FLAO|nr:TonB-dependent receptor [Salegentibacter salinarum]PKD19687.1 SusC/RagA family TonB-linked outer membrane protein [Salegentibacter salinarum]SKB90095.1 TonB-linked outer membrane protein, SusC/RagA family [Salegentibacter salinarum]